MIKTRYKCRYPAEVDVKEREESLQELWPGLRLERGVWDFVTNEWLYTIWFEQEKDYTWFMLKLK